MRAADKQETSRKIDRQRDERQELMGLKGKPGQVATTPAVQADPMKNHCDGRKRSI